MLLMVQGRHEIWSKFPPVPGARMGIVLRQLQPIEKIPQSDCKKVPSAEDRTRLYRSVDKPKLLMIGLTLT